MIEEPDQPDDSFEGDFEEDEGTPWPVFPLMWPAEYEEKFQETRRGILERLEQGHRCLIQCNVEDAESIFAQAYDLAVEFGDPELMFFAAHYIGFLCGLGKALEIDGAKELALKYYERALEDLENWHRGLRTGVEERCATLKGTSN